MKLRNVSRIYALLLFFLASLPFSGLLGAEAEYFTRIEARVLAQDSQKGAAVIIEALRPIVHCKSDSGIKSITVNCPIQDLQYWKTSLNVGDTLWLDWQELQKPSRGWIFRGGRPAIYRLAVPDENFLLSCSCAKKSDIRRAVLVAVLELDDQTRTSGIICEGVGRNWLSNRIPFVKGRTPGLPEMVRLLVGWKPAESLANSKLEATSLSQDYTVGGQR